MQVAPHAAQLLISLSILSIALGNLTVAPLSDRYGRRAIVLLVARAVRARQRRRHRRRLARLLVAARVVQAFGGGAAMSVMRATILDHFGPAHAASALAATATAILVAPMLAPTIGGFVLEWLDWRAVFALSGLLGFAVFLFASRNLRDARRARPVRPGRRCATGRASGGLLASREYLAFLVFGSCMVSMIYTFVTGAPYVAIDVLGVSPSRFGLLLFFPAVASFSRLPARGADDRPPRRPAHDARGRDDRFRRGDLDGGTRAAARVAPACALHSGHGDRLRERDRGALLDDRRDLARPGDRRRGLGAARASCSS